MAHDIDEVWQLCMDIKTDLNQLVPIKTKCDELLSKDNIMRICTTCLGSGKREYVDDEIPGERPCALCNGAKEILFGKIKI